MENNLKALRKKKKITQKEAAAYLKVSLRSYISYENDADKADTFKYQYMIEKLSELNPLDETHGILSLEEIQSACREVFKDYPVNFAYLFGSYAKGTAREDSDVDLVIGTDLSGMRFYGMVDKVKKELRKNVDILTTDQLKDNKLLIDEILKDGVRVYG